MELRRGGGAQPCRPVSLRGRVKQRAIHRPAARLRRPPDAAQIAGCGEHGRKRSRAGRTDAATQRKWHTVRSHRIPKESELPRKHRCQVRHGPGALDLCPRDPACGHSPGAMIARCCERPMGAHRGGKASPRTQAGTQSGTYAAPVRVNTPGD